MAVRDEGLVRDVEKREFDWRGVANAAICQARRVRAERAKPSGALQAAQSAQATPCSLQKVSRESR